MTDLIIIDNVLNDPDMVIEIAKKQKFYYLSEHPLGPNHSCWKGMRTEQLTCDISNPIINNCFTSLIDDTDISKNFEINWSWKGEFYFHLADKTIISNDALIHKDSGFVYAGIIYLNKDPIKDSGTVVFKGKEQIVIDNVYNRFVLYNAEYKHSPLGGFGVDLDSRLTFTMFFSEVNFTIKLPS